MKFRLLLILLTFGWCLVIAQSNHTLKTSEYPLVTIHDVQFIDSVESKGFTTSPLSGDTVRIRGTIMVRPVVDPDTSREPIMYYGTRWGSYIQDTTTGQYWGGLNILQNDTSEINQGTFFDLVDTADYVELTGVVTPYGQTNELMLLLNPVTPVNILGHLSRRPAPIQLSVTDFMKNQAEVKDAFKYSGMYVEVHNLVSANRNASTGQFNAYDENGNYLIVYPQSRYYRLDHKIPYSTYQPPADGTPISSIRGIVTVYNDVFEIIPLYPNDIVVKAVPPVISNIIRSPVKVGTNHPDTIYAKVVDYTATLNKVQMHYKIGDQDRIVVDMNKTQNDTTKYFAVIPGISTDSTLVDYFFTAEDDSNLVGYTPSDTVKGNYFYQVLDEPLTIRDVQYSPLGSGFSSYNGYYVTLTGVVTADTSDIPGFGSGTPLRVYMQQGSGPWTGILIGTLGLNGADVLKFKRGDNVTLTGRITENYSVTSIDSLKQITVNSHNNSLPDFVDLKTADIGKTSGSVVSAEQWESVLADYKDVTVTDENADGDPGANSSNFGEIYVNDGSGDARVELQDGNHNYHNDWDSTLFKDPANKYVMAGSKFSEIQGVIFYSHSYYKLVPRKNDDFSGFVTVGIKNEKPGVPVSFKLDQNYPNPFNPSTTINYSIPKESMVTLKIFNILGQEVKTLVNENKSAGNYSIRFNASSLSSGIYFYSIKAGNFYQVKKMLLLK
jgi:hypothetical protein